MTTGPTRGAIRQLHHWIDGARVDAGGSAGYTATRPTDRCPVAQVPRGDAAVVGRAVDSANRAYHHWRDLAPVARGRLLAELARQLRVHEEEFVGVEVEETGKLVSEMRGGLAIAADYFEFYGGVVRAMFGQTLNLGGEQHAFTTREPYGVVAMITPWNGPLTQAARGVSSALAAGNTVVVKPSEYTSSTAVMLAELASRVGFPPGAFNVVLGGGAEAGAPLVAHPHVRLVAFTGSVATGRMVARSAADRLVPAILELGGKSPNIVFEDADLDRAVVSAAAVCTGAGQQCAALSRLLVHSSIYDDVVERVCTAMAARTPGPRLAPLTTEGQFQKVLAYFDIAASEGARLITGGAAADGELARGRYVLPTVYADVTSAMRIFREEIFGPVLCVSSFDDEDHAVALANDSEYGLVASVWTADSARALRVASRIDAGQVLVNGGRAGIETPFGGYKSSGIGREKGFESLLSYTQTKTTVVSIG